MAEAAGLAASIIAILGLGAKAVQILHTIKDGPENCKKLKDEVASVLGLLGKLNDMAQNLSVTGNEDWVTCIKLLVEGQPSALDRLQSVLQQINLGVGGASPQAVPSRMRKFWRRVTGNSSAAQALTWVFKENEVHDLLSEVSRCKQWIQLALAHDHIQLSRKIRTDVKRVIDGVQHLATGVGELKSEVQRCEVNLDRSISAVANLIVGSAREEQKQQDMVIKEVVSIRETVGNLHKDGKDMKEEYNKCLQWLSPLCFGQIHSEYYSVWEKGTCDWFIESERFKQWLEGGRRILLCTGGPGVGKTILSSRVIQQLIDTARTSSDKKIGVAFIYCNYKDEAAQTARNLTCSILCSLIRSTSLEPILALYNIHNHEGHNTRPTIKELVEVLSQTISQYSQAYIIIDALDELNAASRDDFIGKVRNLVLRFAQNEGTILSLMVTSRNLGLETFQELGLQDNRENCERIEIQASKADITSYIEGQLEDKKRLKLYVKKPESVATSLRVAPCPVGLRQQILDAITKKADGMFLLAKLHIDTLATKTSVKDIRDALKILPSGIDATYDAAMQRITAQSDEDRKLAVKILSWITCTKRPITITELQHALATEIGSSKFDPEALTEMTILLSICAGLVVVNQQNVRGNGRTQFVHYSAQEYFVKRSTELFPDAEVHIAGTCFTYLRFPFKLTTSRWSHDISEAQLIIGNNMLLSGVLFWYCVTHGALHVKEAYLSSSEELTALDSVIDSFLKEQHVLPILLYAYHGNGKAYISPSMKTQKTQVQDCFSLLS
ncbi:hypothetical protein BDZ91DRAFT_786976 [Kalaharituber pfeilii]|nr:hypothetical protein BDZ91DRAFT_786976 [Kalaharituber pfeilii]